jgi:hypothetical protein
VINQKTPFTISVANKIRVSREGFKNGYHNLFLTHIANRLYKLGY